MEGWQRAFVLYSCPWSEISLISDVFMEESGRVCLVAKGARSKHPILKGALRLFTLLSLRLGRRGETKTLRNAEAVPLALPLSGIMLYNGLYINELLFYVLEYETYFSEPFFDYLHCTQSFVGVTGMPESVLCHFELALPGHSGYGVNFTHCAGSDESIDDIMTYRYYEEEGFIANVVIDNKMLTRRRLKVLNAWGSPDADTLCAVKCFIRTALKPYLDGRPLKSRELFRQFMSKRTAKTYCG